MDAADRLVAREQHDQPLDLPPAAEMEVVAQVARAVGERRRLELGIAAETLDEIMGIGDRAGIGQVKLHCLPASARAVPAPAEPRPLALRKGKRSLAGRPTRPTAARLASRHGTWQGPRMAQPPSPSAGGAFIALGAIGGSVIGFLVDQTSAGLFAGTALGILAALAIWWRGRRV